MFTVEFIQELIYYYAYGVYIYWIAKLFAPNNILIKTIGYIYEPALETFSFAKIKTRTFQMDLAPIAIYYTMTMIAVPAVGVVFKVINGG